MKYLIILDPLDTLIPGHDTSVGLMAAIQQRHQRLWVAQCQHLSIENGVAFVNATPITLHMQRTPWYQQAPSERHALHDFHVILMRKDPPFNMDYIFTTHMLDIAESKGTLVSNRPQSLRDFNENLLLNFFPELTTPFLVTADAPALTQFIQTHDDTVIKPLDGMGGTSIYRLSSQNNHHKLITTMTHNGQRPVMIMPYIPEVTQGDKRILLLNGIPCSHALMRVPPKGQLLANIAAGGQGHVVPLTQRDYAIAEAVAPFCQQHGLQLVGLDVIGDHLTEINITSPTCLREISDFCQHDYSMDFILGLEKQL